MVSGTLRSFHHFLESEVLELMGKTRPSRRTLVYLRKLGLYAEVVEKYFAKVEGTNQQAIFKGGFRRDPFGFMDVLAFGGGNPGALAVQVTTRQQMTGHLRDYRRDDKISAAILAWLAAGNAFQIHGWRRRDVPKVSGNGTKSRWDVTVRVITAADLLRTENDIAFMERECSKQTQKEER